MNRPISILLVEDDRDAALLLSLALNEACGPARFVIRCVERLSEAKDALLDERFYAVILDLILPDLMLPEWNGAEAGRLRTPPGGYELRG